MAFKLTLPKFKLKVIGVAAATFFVLTAIAAYMSNREESNSAVSYTHLDVYKRQSML